jgi:hypothetical protein
MPSNFKSPYASSFTSAIKRGTPCSVVVNSIANRTKKTPSVIFNSLFKAGLVDRQKFNGQWVYWPVNGKKTNATVTKNCQHNMWQWFVDWCVAGGWALDLFLGYQTRPHDDLDLALFRDDQLQLRRHLAKWRFGKVIGGQLLDWPGQEWLSSPVHEIHAQAPEAVDTLCLEFLLNERGGAHWIFRRNPAMQRPVREVIGSSRVGLPILCPEVVLLYKAKQPRTIDEHDFSAVVGSLALERRTWLRTALERVHPGHAWLARLELSDHGGEV